MCANGVLGRLVTRFLVNGTELFDLNARPHTFVS